MKKRILTFGVPANHESIRVVGNLNEDPAISDFDAFVFDPSFVVGGVNADHFDRRQAEISDLVTKKGGVVVCLLRQVGHLGFTGRLEYPYNLFDHAARDQVGQVRSLLRAGSGSSIEVNKNAKGATAAYLRILQDKIRFVAYLATAEENLPRIGGTTFAVDSVGHPISFELPIGAGRICFVPLPDGATLERVGSAIARLVEAHYGGPNEIEPPMWAAELRIPGASRYDSEISVLEARKEKLARETDALKRSRDDLLNYRVLLYGYGKSVLEPVVRSAFALFGFRVPEPEEYTGEWDLELHEPQGSTAAIGEIEGSEGIVDVDKFRQLLNYVQDEALEERDHKGILVGNAYRLTAPDAKERSDQFSRHALVGAKRNGFCLVPTTELFKAVCAVLENPEDEELKSRIRNSVLSTVGTWVFAPHAGESQDSRPPEAAAATAGTPSEGI